MKLLKEPFFLILVLLSLPFLINDVEARSLAEIQKSHEIRICLAGSQQNFYQANAAAFVDHLNRAHPDQKIIAKFVNFDKWADQFVDDQGKLRKEASYTPAPLASGQCDLYPNDLARLNWRTNKMAYVPLFTSRNTVIVHKQNLGSIKSIGDLAGKTVAVMEGTSYHTILEDLNSKVLRSKPAKITYLPQKDAMRAVSQQKFDFTLSGADGAFWAINNGLQDIAVAFPIGEKRSVFGWCMRYEDVELQKAVANFFSEQRMQPESEINQNWKTSLGISLYDFDLYVSSTE